MNDTFAQATDGIEPIDLRSLDRCAHLQTRKDRKYIVSRDILASLLEQLPRETLGLAARLPLVLVQYL